MTHDSPAYERETLRLDELARRLGMSMTVAYERARLDALPIPRIPGTGRRYVYSRRAYEALMSAQHDGAFGRAAGSRADSEGYTDVD